MASVLYFYIHLLDFCYKVGLIWQMVLWLLFYTSIHLLDFCYKAIWQMVLWLLFYTSVHLLDFCYKVGIIISQMVQRLQYFILTIHLWALCCQWIWQMIPWPLLYIFSVFTVGSDWKDELFKTLAKFNLIEIVASVWQHQITFFLDASGWMIIRNDV